MTTGRINQVCTVVGHMRSAGVQVSNSEESDPPPMPLMTAIPRDVGRSLHSLPTGLIRPLWTGAEAFVFVFSLGLVRRYGAEAKAFAKAMPYVHP